MGITGGGQKGGGIESRGGEGTRGESQRDKHTALPVCWGQELQLWTGEAGLPCQVWGAAMSASWLSEHKL